MLEFMKEMDDFDAMFFMPDDDDENKVEVHARNFVDKGEPIGGSPMGPAWHVVLFRLGDEGLAEDVDTFDAIFAEPREYISELIPLNFFGVVARKTTTSKVFLQDFIDKLKGE